MMVENGSDASSGSDVGTSTLSPRGVITDKSHDVVVTVSPDDNHRNVKWRVMTPRFPGEADGDTVSPLIPRRNSKTKAMPTSWFDEFNNRFDHAMVHWEKEKILLQQNYKTLVFGVVFQYVHSVATNVVYYLHVQREPLYDLGFAFFPALSKQMQVLSEILFFLMLGYTIAFALKPFWSPTCKNLYTTVIVTRFFGVCVLAQTLRIISFLVTVLPGPNYHCRPGSKNYFPPQTLYDIFLRQDAFYGCGDLVFSSHTIFALLCALTFTHYAPASEFRKKVVMWILIVFFGVLVVSARKHYSLDIVVAWYTVPLLWTAYDKHFPDRIPSELVESLEDKDKTRAEMLV